MHDTEEVKQAKWVPLADITHNDEQNPPEYLFFATAFAFVKIV